MFVAVVFKILIVLSVVSDNRSCKVVVSSSRIRNSQKSTNRGRNNDINLWASAAAAELQWGGMSGARESRGSLC